MIIKCFSIYVITSIFLFSQDKGQSLYDNKKFQEAIEHYETFLNENSKLDLAKFGIGSSAYHLGEKEAAINIFKDISSSADSSLKSKAFYNIATLMNERNKLDESLAYLKKSIELDPNNEDAKINFELIKRMINQNNQQPKSNNGDKGRKQSDSNDGGNKNDKKEQKNTQSNGKSNDNATDDSRDQNDKESAQEDNNDNIDSEKDKQDENNSEELGNNQKGSLENNNNQIDESKLGKNSETNNSAFDKTDKQIQAEAILEALKDKDKINQRRKISGKRSLKLLKDW